MSLSSFAPSAPKSPSPTILGGGLNNSSQRPSTTTSGSDDNINNESSLFTYLNPLGSPSSPERPSKNNGNGSHRKKYKSQQQQQQQQHYSFTSSLGQPTITNQRTSIGSVSSIPFRIEMDNQQQRRLRWQHLYVLPVLLLEFLAIALTRAVLPVILLEQYGNQVYLILGCADCVRGLLAFIACPVFGKLSDVVGRRLCLLITVLGSCAPVCSLALFTWERNNNNGNENGLFIHPQEATSILYNNNNNNNLTEIDGLSEITNEESQQSLWPMTYTTTTNSEAATHQAPHPQAISVFIVLLALSGIFSSTFTLVFAYISDTVRARDERVSAYGLALATFGLSFTIGPMVGGYLAQYNTHYVFVLSFVFAFLDLLYIYFILPESNPNIITTSNNNNNNNSIKPPTRISMMKSIEHNWSPWETIRIVTVDPFLRVVGQVAFLYYTGLWALISTLSLYAVKRFHLTPERLGELMASLGLCTMLAEAVLVRIVVPLVGEKQATKIGLLSFTFQCIVLGFAYEGWHLFICVGFSLMANLVYPSLSSMVSGGVEPEAVGEALGAVNGIKALTEGIGPLVFGSLMTLSETSPLPGWPYLLAAMLVLAAYKKADELPNVNDDDYIHELEVKREEQKLNGSIMMGLLGNFNHNNKRRKRRIKDNDNNNNFHLYDNDDNVEYQRLLSEVEEESSDDEEDRY